jgi:site-specific DNA recombinase
MIEASKKGKLMARPPFGYKVIEGNLVVDGENSQNVKLIFDEFAGGKSLNQISQIYGISVNGIKKILKNFAYLGKIKFAGQIVNGNHTPLISAELFNRVQKRFENAENRIKMDNPG